MHRRPRRWVLRLSLAFGEDLKVVIECKESLMKIESNIFMEFHYFKAAESEMHKLLPGEHTCSICGNIGRCFEIDYLVGEDIKDFKAGIGCYDCLKNRCFGFFHITEAGYLDENGITNYNENNEDEKPHIFIGNETGEISINYDPDISSFTREIPQLSEESIDEMRCTPVFPTWQEVGWPIHCNDFMIYLGSWQPKDFELFNNGNGRLLFLDMTDREYHNCWPSEQVSKEEWGIAYYAFKCTQCDKLRGICDFD
jgi:hypothetical protein